MKYYKTVTLRSNSKGVISIPKDVWVALGWDLNEQLRLSYTYSDPDGWEKTGLMVNKKEDY
tara:strand:- start:341 stop:523 length:183 start_codon:yes stop_codon:yes gene_type:complete